MKIDKQAKCHFCNQQGLELLHDFGQQVRCIDFKSNNEPSADKLFDFTLVQCHSCGLIQLYDPIPYQLMVPDLAWLMNKEPDQHHALMANDIIQLLGKEGKVLFVSKFERKIYTQVKRVIGEQAYLFDPEKDLNIDCSDPGQATLQNYLTPDNLSKLRDKLGKFDLIVSCRLLEHAHESHQFIQSLRNLLKSKGRLIVEVPDSSKPLLQGELTMLWEEHTNYFTLESLKSAFAHIGMTMERAWTFPYLQEDAIAAMFSESENRKEMLLPNIIGEQYLAKNYAQKITNLKEKILAELQSLVEQCGDIVIFGAGHKTVTFVNFLGIASKIKFIVDDDENKQGLFLPGTAIKIINSHALSKERVKVCLLAVGIHLEDKIMNKLKPLNPGIEYFYSISPDSQYALAIYQEI